MLSFVFLVTETEGKIKLTSLENTAIKYFDLNELPQI